MSSIGQAVAGPRFYEMDDVRPLLFLLAWFTLEDADTETCLVVRQEEDIPRQLGNSAERDGESRRDCGETTFRLDSLSIIIFTHLLTTYFNIEMAVAIGEFALAIGELSGSELSKQLSHSLAVMSDVEKKAQDLQQEQALEDTTTFMNTAEEYVRLIGSVRVCACIQFPSFISFPFGLSFWSFLRKHVACVYRACTVPCTMAKCGGRVT